MPADRTGSPAGSIRRGIFCLINGVAPTYSAVALSCWTRWRFVSPGLRRSAILSPVLYDGFVQPKPLESTCDQETAQGCSPCRRTGHALPARHQGDGKGNAAGRGQAIDPVRRRGSPCRRDRAVLHDHRPWQDRPGGTFRRRLRTGKDAARARQDGRARRLAGHADRTRLQSSPCASKPPWVLATPSGAPAPSSATTRSPSCCRTTLCCPKNPASRNWPRRTMKPAATSSR